MSHVLLGYHYSFEIPLIKMSRNIRSMSKLFLSKKKFDLLLIFLFPRVHGDISIGNNKSHRLKIG